MAKIVFYEKSGCTNNTRQKELLVLAGHEVIEKNLLTYPWTRESLLVFFQGKKIQDCFNPNAPGVKHGEIKPDEYTLDSGIQLMIEYPIFIKRPLMVIDPDSGGENTMYIQGFDKEIMHDLIGLKSQTSQNGKFKELQENDIVTCKKTSSESCNEKRYIKTRS